MNYNQLHPQLLGKAHAQIATYYKLAGPIQPAALNPKSPSPQAPVTSKAVEVPKSLIAKYPPELLVLLVIKEAERVSFKKSQGVSFRSLKETLADIPLGVLRAVISDLVNKGLINKARYNRSISGQKSHTVYTLSDRARQLIPEKSLKKTSNSVLHILNSYTHALPPNELIKLLQFDLTTLQNPSYP